MQLELTLGQICENLEALIKAKEDKELECREYLQFAKELLVSDTVSRFEYVEIEHRSNSGDSDYVISGLVQDEGGIEAVRVYIWELKSPQCFLFKKETENRLIPSPELIKAENQLLNYHHNLKGNADFRDVFGVTHQDNVCFGGIIIGTKDNLVSGSFPDDKKRKLYATALMIRKQYFYKPLNIRIITWDRILAHIQQIRPKPSEYSQIQAAITTKPGETEPIEIIAP